MADATTVIPTLSGAAKWTPDGGSVVTIPHVKVMSRNKSAANNSFHTSSTGGKVARTKGPEDRNGTMDGLEDDTDDWDSTFDVGDVGVLAIHADIASSAIWAENIMVDSLNFGVNPETGEPVSVSLSFSQWK